MSLVLNDSCDSATIWAANSFAELVAEMHIEIGNVSGATVSPEQNVFNNGNRNSHSGLVKLSHFCLGIVINKFYTRV